MAAGVSNLSDGATYHFAVTAYDASHTETGFSNDASATIPAGAPVAGFTASTTSGIAPVALNFSNTSTGSISSYAWNFGDGTTSTAQSPSHVYSAAGVYTVSLTVTGSGGSNTKTMPNYVTVTATPSDTSPPTAPSMLAATASGANSINLNWNASTDNVGVVNYRLERCQGIGCTSFAQIATATGTTFSNAGLASGTSYSYRVRAIDGAGNTGAYSNSATTTTAQAPDTSPPTAPTGLVGSASGNGTISVSWQASSDNVGVTSYRIERCQGIGCASFVQIATTAGTTFSNTGLAAGTSFSFRVRASDAAGNVSAYSNLASATTASTAIAPVAAFSGSPTSGAAPLTVNFSSSSTGTISTYAWNFGDGTTSTAQNPSHVYTASGTYTVSLTVSGAAGSNTISAIREQSPVHLGSDSFPRDWRYAASVVFSRAPANFFQPPIIEGA